MKNRAPERIDAKQVKDLNKVVKQHLLNAELLGVANYGLGFSAMELGVAIDTLQRLRARMLAQLACDNARVLPTK